MLDFNLYQNVYLLPFNVVILIKQLWRKKNRKSIFILDVIIHQAIMCKQFQTVQSLPFKIRIRITWVVYWITLFTHTHIEFIVCRKYIFVKRFFLIAKYMSCMYYLWSRNCSRRNIFKRQSDDTTERKRAMEQERMRERKCGIWRDIENTRMQKSKWMNGFF